VQPRSLGTHMGWLLFEKVMQDMRLPLGDRSEQLSSNPYVHAYMSNPYIHTFNP